MFKTVKWILPTTLFLISFTSKANVIGTDAQNFNPTSNGVDFVTVQSGRTLDAGILNFGLFLNYAGNTLSFLETADPKAKASRTKINDKLLSADFSFGLGLTKNLDFGVTLPFLLNQEIKNDNQIAYFAARGNTEQRINAKYKFYESATWANALVVTVNNNNIANNPYLGIDAGLTKTLELATSWQWQDNWIGLNFGHRWKDTGASLSGVFGIDPLPNMYVYSAAWSRMVNIIDTKIIFELFGSSPSQKNNDVNLSDRQQSTLEALVGLKHTYSENIALHAGVGTEVNQGFGTPDWRIYAGLNWTLGPLWKKTVREETKVQLEKVPKPKTQRFVLNLRFKFDSDELEQQSWNDLDQVIEAIRATANVELIAIEGHTDSSGNDDYNQKLSERRALAIKKLISQKTPFDIKLIESFGYGETKPIADNGNYQGRQKNRRVVVIVYSRVDTAEDTVIEIKLTE